MLLQLREGEVCLVGEKRKKKKKKKKGRKEKKRGTKIGNNKQEIKK